MGEIHEAPVSVIANMQNKKVSLIMLQPVDSQLLDLGKGAA